MGLFDDPAELTRQDLIGIGKRAQAAIDDAFGRIADLVWRNSHGLTPQQAFDALGPRAGTAMQLFDGIRTLLNFVDAGKYPSTIPADTTLAVNKDGTVTLTVVPKPEPVPDPEPLPEPPLEPGP